MSTRDASILIDRLLYGPNNPSIGPGPLIVGEENVPITHTTTSSAVVESSPTGSHPNGPLSAKRNSATSTAEVNAVAPVSPVEHLDTVDHSVTSSPTLANISPVDSQAKQQYHVHGIEAESPKSANVSDSLGSRNGNEPAVEETVHGSSKESGRTSHRSSYAAFKAWKSISSRPSATWHPTAYQIRPLIGILGLCVAVACAFASLSVLIVSDGQATTNWYVAPSVLLAIITAVANSAIALAYMEAVSISFWYSMTRGRTIESLERQWQISRSILLAVAKLRHLSVLNLACIAVAVVVIDGPLLQRASTVVRVTQSDNVTLSLRMLPEIPLDFTGVVTNHLLLTKEGSIGLFTEYTTDEPMRLDVKGCNGKCAATIQAPGVFKTDCSTEVWPIEPEMLHSNNASWGEWRSEEVTSGASGTVLPSFEVSVAPIYTLDSSAAVVRVGFASWKALTGNYSMTTCLLVPAISEYDVEIEDGIVRIPQTSSQGRVIQLANNTRAVDQSINAMPRPQNSAMDAVSVDIGLLTNSNVTMIRAKEATPDVRYAVYALTYNLFSAQRVLVSESLDDMEWDDPTDDILFIANSLMFRAGIMSLLYRDHAELATLIDPGVSMDQTVSAKEEITQNVYKSDLRWYAGAAIVQIATALITLPMFWGWWRLGCDLTLSPFSIALAFDSPVLSDVNSATGAKGVVDRLGDMGLKYGAVESPEEKARGSGFNGRLGVADSQVVFRPHAGMTFQQ